MNYRIVKVLGLVIVLCSLAAQAQPRFQDEIKAFKKQDSISAPPKNAILFYGSSSFRLWKDLNDYFPGYTMINRGVGGATFPDLIGYVNDIVIPYAPKQIVIYCGDNDLASSDEVIPRIVLNRFKDLVTLIRVKLPDVNIVYVAIKPSPGRRKLMPKIRITNNLIGQYLSKDKNASFIDIYNDMLTPKGKPIGELFKDDSLHMNEKGYAIWQKAIAPKLIK